MGIAAADYSGDGRTDLLVTNSHKQLHAVFRSDASAGRRLRRSATPARISPGRSTRRLAGWGASWVDLDLDGNLDLVLANGSIPVEGLKKSAEPVQVFENLTAHDRPGEFADATRAVGLAAAPRVIGRGLAAADYDNDGSMDFAVGSVGGKLMLLRNTGAKGNWLDREDGAVRAGDDRDGGPAERTPARAGAEGGQQLPLLRGSARALRARAREAVSELIVRSPGGRERRLTDVKANQVLDLAR